MKKTIKCPSLIIAAFTVLSFASCQDWGQTDPPAGNQTYPTLEKVATYSFDDEELDVSIFQLFAYDGGDTPSLYEDEERGGCLYLNNGYTRISNPLQNVTVQNGVSLTFWAKQLVQTSVDEEGETVELDQDLEGALFSYVNTNETQRMFFTANGWLSYSGVEGEYEYNNPTTEYKTGMMTPGEWHYVAVMVRNDGYEVYVDGYRKIDKTVATKSDGTFDFSTIVQFMASTPYMYIGYGSDTDTQPWLIDELTIYRNQITESQISPTGGSSSGSEEESFIILGNTDFSSGFWTEFSDAVSISVGQTTHFGFYNYTSGAANWDNWIMVFSGGGNPLATNYVEYYVLRADAWGWDAGNCTASDITSNYNWDTFTSDMNGAYVEVTLKRPDSGTVEISCVTTTTSGSVYTQSLTITGDFPTNFYASLTLEAAYLMIDPYDVYTSATIYNSGSYIVGETDKSTAWWTAFSDGISTNGNLVKGVTFYNYSSGAANWDNYLLVCASTADRSASNYVEYYVLRADAYGWGNEGYDAANMTANYDWNTFISDISGSKVKVFLQISDGTSYFLSKVTTAAGVALDDYTYWQSGISGAEFFFTIEAGYMDILSIADYPLVTLEQ